MEFEYFDIHSHLNFPQFDKDREEVIEKMKAKKIGTICVGTDLKTSKECVELANKHENIWAIIGVHPTDNEEGFSEKEYEKLLRGSTSKWGPNSKSCVVGIGECGLDYFNVKKEECFDNLKIVQKKTFEKQIEFAIKHNLPLMIHCRDLSHQSSVKKGSYEDTLDILNKYKGKVRGNIHFFSGTKEIAKRFIKLGFTISFTAVLTLTNQYDDVVKQISLDKIMSETDAPFVAPISHRGKRNEPIYVKEVVKKIAEIRGEDYEKIKNQLVRNALKFYNLYN